MGLVGRPSGVYFRGAEVLFDDPGYVVGRNPRVPDVVGEDEDYRPLLVAAGAGVPQHDGGRYTPALHLAPERLQELAPALLAAAALPRGCADEDLAERRHGQILSRAGEKSRGGIRFQAIGFSSVV